MSNHLDDLYRDILMEHYRFPHGDKDIDDPDLESAGVNPACGDEIDIKVKFSGNRVKDIGVHCMGCAISIASGSILAELVRGKSIEEIKRIAGLVKALLKDEKIDEDVDLGDLEALKGVKKFPVRIKCALLSWTTLVEALEAHGKGIQNDTAKQKQKP
jgi:nitrogen fixation NifU-like protein